MTTGPEGAHATIHVDMDAFFAAVEVLDRPELRGRPVVVGGSPQSRGVVSTASYEARRFGVRSAMSAREAHRLCPEAVFLPVRGERYVTVSRQVMGILRQEGAVIEQLSIDEAYVQPPAGQSPVAVARRIKQRIAAETGLTASVGVAPNKLLAKLASDMRKPDGFAVITPDAVDEVLAPLPVRALPGVGPKTAGELAELGIATVAQLRRADPGLMRLQFGRRADELFQLARGEDHRPVEPEHETKSIGTETTFGEDVGDWSWLGERLREFAVELAAKLQPSGWRARTVTVKLRFADFHTVSRSQTVSPALRDPAAIGRVAVSLLRRIERLDRVRLIGLQLSGLTDQPEPVQLSFPFREDPGGPREAR